MTATFGEPTSIRARPRTRGSSPKRQARALGCSTPRLPSSPRAPDLPDFDIIGLHGIWTWISEENSRVVVDIIRRKLKVGGLVYVSYNCLPGWAPAMPLRHLMKLHADLAAEAAGVVAKVDGAVAFAQQVIDSGALYFRANPAVGERLKALSALSRNYLVHEYFTEDWRQITFSDMARVLEDAKLSFVGSAHLLDHVEAVNLSEAGQKLLSGIGHPILRQSVRDYLVNQQFRRDIFAKGSRRLSSLEQAEAFRQQPFVLLTAPGDIPMKVAGSLGEAKLDEQFYRPLIESFASEGFAPKTLGQVAMRHPDACLCAAREPGPGGSGADGRRASASGPATREAGASALCRVEPSPLRKGAQQRQFPVSRLARDRRGRPRQPAAAALPARGAQGKKDAERTERNSCGTRSRRKVSA